MKKIITVILLLVAMSGNATTLRLLFVYSDGAVADTAIGQIDYNMFSRIDKANTIFANSNVDLKLEIAGRLLLSDIDTNGIEYTNESVGSGLSFVSGEAYSAFVAVPWIHDDESYQYKGLAVDYGADLIVMVSSASQSVAEDSNLCGRAIVPREPNYFHESASKQRFRGMISILESNNGIRCSSAILAHEVGHTLGSGHLYGGDSAGIFEDAHGYLCGGKSTLMADQPSIRIDYVSNPDIMHRLEPCGDVDYANNSRVFGITAPLVAKRLTPSDWSYLGNYSLYSNVDTVTEGETVTFTVERSGDLRHESSIDIVIQLFGWGDIQAEDFSSLSENVTLDFAADQQTQSISYTLVDDSDVEELQTFSVHLINGGSFSSDDSEIMITVNDNDESQGEDDSEDSEGESASSDSSSNGGGSLFYLTLLVLLITLNNHKKY